MATSASQTYLSKLGFQDLDRNKDRHGLACEYLFEKLIELEEGPRMLENEKWRLRDRIEDASLEKKRQLERLALAERTKASFPTSSDYIAQIRKELSDACEQLENIQSQHDQLVSAEPFVNSARERLLVANCTNVPIKSRSYVVGFADVLIDERLLGEVKITRQPAEQVLQQVNFYKRYLNYVQCTYILVDYDCSDLQRLTEGSDIKVFRLGQRFDEWIQDRPKPQAPEL